MNSHALETLEFGFVLERLMARARSPIGQETVRSWKPLNSTPAIRKRMREIDEMRLLRTVTAFPFDELRAVIEPVDHAAVGGQLGVPDLFDVLTSLRAVIETSRILDERAADAPTLAKHRNRLPESVETLAQRLSAVIADRDRIRDDASLELARLRKQREKTAEQIRSKLNTLVQSAQVKRYLQEEVPTVRDRRHVLVVQQRYQDRIAGTLRGQSTSGASVFIEPEQITPLENELKTIDEAEFGETERILWELSGDVGASADVLNEAFRAVGYLDAIHATAHIAEEWSLTTPEVVDAGPLRLDSARNPILIALALDVEGVNPKDAVVPTTLRIGESFDCLVITGPNTGGKTVALKTTGLCILMALTGLPIPASATSSIPRYKEIWADIGDEQSVQQNLSTFSAHLRRVVDAMRAIPEDGNSETNRSLVLLDELGAGTDPTEGAALGEAILRELLDRGAHVVATTHLGQLKQFGHTHPRAENGSVGFDPDTLAPTYELDIGTPGSSHALYIARRMGMPERVLDAAGATLDRGDQRSLDELIAEVQRVKRDLATQQRALGDREQEVRALREDAERRVAEAQRTAQRDEGPLIGLLRDIADEVGRLAKAGRVSRAELRDDLLHIRERIRVEVPQSVSSTTRPTVTGSSSAKLTPFTPKAGDTVRVKSLNRLMEVSSIDEKRGRVEVTRGTMRTMVPLSDIAPS